MTMEITMTAMDDDLMTVTKRTPTVRVTQGRW